MAPLVFMSPEHVALLNDRFAASAELREAAARLPRDVVWVHRLSDDIGGRTIWWQSRFSPRDGIVLSLEPYDGTPDLLWAADYWEMVAATAAMVAGRTVPLPGHAEIGDADFMAPVAELHAIGWRIGQESEVVYPTRPGRDNLST